MKELDNFLFLFFFVVISFTFSAVTMGAILIYSILDFVFTRLGF